MRKQFSGKSFRRTPLALLTCAFLAGVYVTSCAQSNGSGGLDTGTGGSKKGTGGATSGGRGGTKSTKGSGGSSETSSGDTSESGGSGGSGGSSSGGSGGSSSGGSGGSSSGGSGGSPSGTGGSSSGTGGSSTTTSTTPPGPSKTTADLIGPGGKTSGNPNGTHGDKWICILNYPGTGENIIGAWYSYPWGTSNCGQAMSLPAGGGPPLCFKGGNCTGATPGAGLGFNMCDPQNVNTATWPQMNQLITAGSLSKTVANGFGQCNAGAKITSVNWTLASGSTPAGMAVELGDGADTALARVGNLAEGATSAAVPANVDGSKIARIKFQFDGTTIKNWDFCLKTLTLSYQ